MPGAYRRPLTAQESKKVKDAVKKFSSTPPWTDEVEENNQQFRKLISELFMDGVSMSNLAEAAGWTVGRMNQQILKSRAEGLLAGKRRLPEPPPKPAPLAATRDITDSEARELQDLLEAVPRLNHINNQKTANQINWNTPQGRKMLRQVKALQVDRVSVARCAAAVGLSRALLSSRLLSLDAPADAPQRKKRLPDRIWNDLVDRSADLPVSRRAERHSNGNRLRPLTWIYTRKWSNELGRGLISEARDLIDAGYGHEEVAAALELEPRQLNRLIRLNSRSGQPA